MPHAGEEITAGAPEYQDRLDHYLREHGMSVPVGSLPEYIRRPV